MMFAAGVLRFWQYQGKNGIALAKLANRRRTIVFHHFYFEEPQSFGKPAAGIISNVLHAAPEHRDVAGLLNL